VESSIQGELREPSFAPLHLDPSRELKIAISP